MYVPSRSTKFSYEVSCICMIIILKELTVVLVFKMHVCASNLLFLLLNECASYLARIYIPISEVWKNEGWESGAEKDPYCV